MKPERINMNTLAEKAHESKSQSTNVVAKRQNDKSAFQFVDNRPEAIVQRKLQKMASNSPQVKQAAQLQAMANAKTIQAKPKKEDDELIQKKEIKDQLSDNFQSSELIQQKALAKNKLNVAGETHGESNLVRDKERRYTVAMTGGVYETEGDFKTRKWFLFGNDRLGDPMLLRAEMLLAILKEKTLQLFLLPFSNNIVPVGLPAVDLATLWGVYRAELKKQLDEIALALVLASNEKAEQTEAVKGQRTHGLVQRLSGGLPNSILTDVGPTIIPEVQGIITAFATDVLGAADIRTEAAVSSLRSSAMQQAAEDNGARWIGGQKGVWKVGQAHIAEIAAEKTADNYELLTKNEFNADFQNWSAQNP